MDEPAHFDASEHASMKEGTTTMHHRLQASAEAPSMITVTGTSYLFGAYNDEWNLNGENNGRPKWHRKGNNDDRIQWSGSEWQLKYIYSQPAFTNDLDSYLPPKTGWSLGSDATGETPTLTYGIGAWVDCT